MKLTANQPSPFLYALIAILSIQFGSALAKSLFPALGPWGVVALRSSISAIVLFAVWRPKWRPLIRRNLKNILAFGTAMALMNACFYLALDRIPLGITIALEFTGPLGLSIFKSNHWRDYLWAILAMLGVVLLTPLSGLDIDPMGVILALTAGVFWAIYILLAARLGKELSGVEGLAWSLVVSSMLLLPMGIATAGSALIDPKLLPFGIGVALLSTALPYSCEFMALKRMPVKTFGVMLSIEPMMGAFAGLLILGETLSARSLIACLLVSLAAAGAAQFKEANP
ncbi:MAG: EamA family transporter [Cyanobacteria bacterium J06554_3]